ncbi:MAG: TrkH family potassium uptake protein [Firmicutes bacterium]|nr:TrkH family potassium uptake protein [Candidatus Colimorpha enterica]
MNRKIVINMTGRILALTGLLMVLPLIVSLIYSEYHSAQSFGMTIIITIAVGAAIYFPSRSKGEKDRLLFTREGLMIVGIAWLAVSLIGAVPFVIDGCIPSFADAFFETASGFSTTGATILSGERIEAMTHGMLFWRSFTHWIGGMGVLVFIMALMPSDEKNGRSMHIMKAEMPGPIVGKLVPRVKDTAKVLYLLYIVLTLVETILLWAGDMNFFESIVHALGTAGTGGFGTLGDSIGSFSPYTQWVITAFMVIFAINFNLYYFIVIGRIKDALSSRELWLFLLILTVAAGAMAVNIYPIYNSISESIRHAAFQTASLASTTGYGTADINAWPTFSKIIMIALMFIGGCAGSTAGGLKLSRVMLMFKSCKRNLTKTFYPRSVNVVRLDGKKVDDETTDGVGIYFTLYAIIFAIIVLLLSYEPFDFEMIFTSVLSCLNNIGPCFSTKLASPQFADYSTLSKVILGLAMLLGRLELYPMLFVFTPRRFEPTRTEKKTSK